MITSRPLLNLAVGVVLGVLTIGAIRYVTFEQPEGDATHYHANFAVFLNGERVDLTDARYMEDVARCQVDPRSVAPEDRAHMHGGVGDVVHVHHRGATWGHFFANIGWALGDDYIFSDTGTRRFNTDTDRLKFIVNGRAVQTLTNRVIGDVQRIVISYGPESVDEVIEQQFPLVAENAQEFNDVHLDPGGCTGSGPPPLTTGEKLRRAFLF